MHIDRYMVNLFFEIKRNLPSEHGSDLKISDPELSSLMIKKHLSCSNEAIHRLIEVFFERAGGAEYAKFQNATAIGKSTVIADNKRTKKRYYRGALIQ